MNDEAERLRATIAETREVLARLPGKLAHVDGLGWWPRGPKVGVRVKTTRGSRALRPGVAGWVARYGEAARALGSADDQLVRACERLGHALEPFPHRASADHTLAPAPARLTELARRLDAGVRFLAGFFDDPEAKGVVAPAVRELCQQVHRAHDRLPSAEPVRLPWRCRNPRERMRCRGLVRYNSAQLCKSCYAHEEYLRKKRERAKAAGLGVPGKNSGGQAQNLGIA